MVKIPIERVLSNIIYDLLVIILITDDMLMIIPLPDFFASNRALIMNILCDSRLK